MREKEVWTGAPTQALNLWVFLVCGFFCWLIIPLFYAFWRWLVVRCTSYEVTSERLRISSGVLTRRIDEVELYRIKDITFVQPLDQRIFGVANVEILTSDPGTPEVTLAAIPDAEAVMERLRRSVEDRRDQKRIRDIDVAEMTGLAWSAE